LIKRKKKRKMSKLIR